MLSNLEKGNINPLPHTINIKSVYILVEMAVDANPI